MYTPCIFIQGLLNTNLYLFLCLIPVCCFSFLNSCLNFFPSSPSYVFWLRKSCLLEVLKESRVEGGNSRAPMPSQRPPACAVLDHRWVSVLTNSKEEALAMAFRGEQSTGENSLEDLTKAIIEDVQRMPGNDVCCDCGSSGIFL